MAVESGTSDARCSIPVETPPIVRDRAGKELVAACLAGDPAARERFQEEFGPLLYQFAGYFGRSDHFEPGDFYLYLLEGDRLYQRLRSYEGRSSLRAFLRGYILPDLLRRFRQMVEGGAIHTVPLDEDRSPAAAERSPADPVVERATSRTDTAGKLFARLEPEKQLLVKLLYIEDFAFSARDVQLLAERSGRSIIETATLIEQARESVRAREAARRQRFDHAESVAQRILRYQHRLRQIADDLARLPASSAQSRLHAEQADLTRKVAWRAQQRTRAFADSERATVTLRYRDIAQLLNAPVGSVSAQVTRLRKELLDLAAQPSGQSGRRREDER